MPIIENARTVESHETWASPDGKIKAYEVILLVNDKKLKTQTYSNQIATVGWSGTLDSYEKGGRTLVRQPQKQMTSSARPMADAFSMYLSYAKDLVIAWATIYQEAAPNLTDWTDKTLSTAYELWNSRPDGKPAEVPETNIADALEPHIEPEPEPLEL